MLCTSRGVDKTLTRWQEQREGVGSPLDIHHVGLQNFGALRWSWLDARRIGGEVCHVLGGGVGGVDGDGVGSVDGGGVGGGAGFPP